MSHPDCSRQMIGVLGGGQLGQMLGMAGVGLGRDMCFLDPAEHPPAAQVGRHIQAEYDDVDALDEFVRSCERITLEFENVPEQTARRLAEQTLIAPGPEALAVAQDRLVEKRFLHSLQLETAPYVAIGLEQQDAIPESFWESGAILKTRRMGYDGKGQVTVKQSEALSAAHADLGNVPCVLEGRVAFEREVSMVCARGADGAMVFYPLTENEHRDGILFKSHVCPDDPLQQPAEQACRKVAQALDYQGVLTLEFFVSQGRLIVNEMAPRVHNSGHWSLGGAVCSQFENHLRALLGWPLGSTRPHGAVLMRNLVGQMPEPQAVLMIPGVVLQDYGKAARPGRKVGHITLIAEDAAALAERERQLEAALASVVFG